MSDSTDDPDRATERLEAALERIARRTAGQAPIGHPTGQSPGGTTGTADVAAGLDTLIENLRAALGRTPGDRAD